jgi:hypothetical protein
VDLACGDFFADAGFTFDQDGGRSRRDDFNLCAEGQRRCRITGDARGNAASNLLIREASSGCPEGR